MKEYIDILGIRYELELVDVIDRFVPREGEIDYLNQTIKIEKALCQDKRQIALLHEILHGIVDALSIECLEDNEGAIQSLAIGLYNTLKNNHLTFS